MLGSKAAIELSKNLCYTYLEPNKNSYYKYSELKNSIFWTSIGEFSHFPPKYFLNMYTYLRQPVYTIFIVPLMHIFIHFVNMWILLHTVFTFGKTLQTSHIFHRLELFVNIFFILWMVLQMFQLYQYFCIYITLQSLSYCFNIWVT